MRKRPPEPSPPGGYFVWSKDPAVALLAVLPLWLAYEGLRLRLAPDERNGAEAMICEALRLLGPAAFDALRALLALAVIGATVVVVRRGVPWVRVTLVTALEGLVYALVLGPLASALATSSVRLLARPAFAPGDLLHNVVGSLGAGIFEELAFRLVLLSVLALLCGRAAVSFGLPRSLGIAAAIGLSAVAFSLFHHLGPGAPPLARPEFVFRACAGVALGVLFAVRGFGVCVYAHALYDVHYYLTQA